MRYFLLTLSVLVCLAAACNKKPKAPAPGVADHLRAGKWKLSSGTVTIALPDGRDTTLDYLKFIPECYKDDYFTFDSINHGRRYTGTTCTPADPEYFSFIWELGGNNNQIDIYNGFNWVYGIIDTVHPFEIHKNVNGVDDTIVGRLDTLVPPKDFIQLDTIRKLTFHGVPGGIGETGLPRGGFDIYSADLYSVSASTFTIHFQMHTYRMDTTNRHAASFLLPLEWEINPGEYQVLPYYQRDTVDYILNFKN
jgi:hypothetical protein